MDIIAGICKMIRMLPNDPLPYFETAGHLSMLIGLLSAWKQERGGRATDKKNDFMQWLAEHHFSELQSRISQSDTLQRELNALLQDSIENLSFKFEQVEKAVIEVSAKIDGLSGIARAFSGLQGSLSSQAKEILKWFTDSGANLMYVHQEPSIKGGYDTLLEMVGHESVRFEDQRFIPDDLQTLCQLNLIVRDHSKRDEMYRLTRAGSDYASTLPAFSPSKLT